MVNLDNLPAQLPSPQKNGSEFIGWYTASGSSLCKENLCNDMTLTAKWKDAFTYPSYGCNISYEGFFIKQTNNSIQVRGGWGSTSKCSLSSTIDTTGWNYITIDGTCTAPNGETRSSVTGNVSLTAMGGNKYRLNGATSVTISYSATSYSGNDGYDGPYYAYCALNSVKLSSD